jgi:hypothetical protein
MGDHVEPFWQKSILWRDLFYRGSALSCGLSGLSMCLPQCPRQGKSKP